MIGLRIIWAGFFILTSLYCLLAYMPYTYCALVKAPPYFWLTWFVRHHALLYWVALMAGAISFRPNRKTPFVLLPWALQGLLGLFIALRPFMAALQSDTTAYVWSLITLVPVVLTASVNHMQERSSGSADAPSKRMLGYWVACLGGVVVALVYTLGWQLRHRVDLHTWSLQLRDLVMIFWSVVSHVAIAIGIVTVVNVIRKVSWRASDSKRRETFLLSSLIWVVLTGALLRFLNNALGFQGWQARAYAMLLALAFVTFGLSLVIPLQTYSAVVKENTRKILWVTGTLVLTLVAIVLPVQIGDGDWNGILQSTFACVFWTAWGLCLYRLRPARAQYSNVTIAAVVLFTAFTYKSLQATSIFWAKSVGPTDDDIAVQMENYGAQDPSFQLANHTLGNGREEECRDLCRILRAYTNIRNAEAKSDLKLVENLTPTQEKRPSIFIFVIDSMRPDYLGAYNPKVDFTPNIDAFARESIVFHNAYTQYAGTTLSEPAIWSGALLLHAHYLKPFSKVNSLEKMAITDGYQIVVSYDTVLPDLLSPSDSLVKLDTDKLWNEYEVCSTIEQAEHYLGTRVDRSSPVLFYAQPMNVHQFAKNKVPLINSSNWQNRPGINNRIAYEVHHVDGCLGGFVNYLKKTGRYDDSIIVLASDHGDATGELGRFSHSLWIYPEIMRVPLIVHLPTYMRDRLVHDPERISTLTDVTPSLYYLLGHRPIVSNPLFGRPLFAKSSAELESYRRDEIFMASDARAAYGILSPDGRYLYTTYDAPAKSYLFDLKQDPNAQHSILSGPVKEQYDERIIGRLQDIAGFYGYQAGLGTLLAKGPQNERPRGYVRVRSSDGFLRDIPIGELEAMRRQDTGLTVVSH